MTVLTAKTRAALPPKVFAGPHESFPIENADHAVAALRDISKAEAAGHLTSEQAAHIRARAHSYLAAHSNQSYGAQVMNAAGAMRR